MKISRRWTVLKAVLAAAFVFFAPVGSGGETKPNPPSPSKVTQFGTAWAENAFITWRRYPDGQ